MTVTTDRARGIETLRLAEQESRQRVDECQTHYCHMRRTIRQAEISRTRQAWGLALIEWVNALLARAAAEDDISVAARLAAMDDKQRIQP